LIRTVDDFFYALHPAKAHKLDVQQKENRKQRKMIKNCHPNKGIAES
jgi:hypothetical protein